MKILAIVILYNEYLKDSLTYNSLKKYSFIDIAIYDNSEESYLKENIKEKSNVFYEGNGINIGLSRAYNLIINKYPKYDYYITLDSDTLINKDYFEEIINLIEDSKKYEVYLPQIRNGATNKIIFPKKYYSYPIGLVKNNMNETKYYDSINSGTIYSKRVFEKLSFDETQFLEQVDSAMFKKLKESKIKQKKMKAILIQNFSFDYEKKEITKRDIIRKNDAINYWGQTWFFFALLMYTRKSIQKKNLIYINKFINLYLKKVNASKTQ